MEIFVQVAMPMAGNIPEDVSINTWTFTTSLDEASAQPLIGAGLLAFYNQIAEYYSPYVLIGDTRLKAYNLDDPEPRAPIAEAGLPIVPGAAGIPLPNEVAACLSFRGQLVSGSNPARRRGRVYLGPLCDSAYGSSIPSGPGVGPDMLDDLELATAAMQSELGAQTNHVVWSRSDAAFIPVATYWCDDAFDTQRSRGPQALARRVWAQGS